MFNHHLSPFFPRLSTIGGFPATFFSSSSQRHGIGFLTRKNLRGAVDAAVGGTQQQELGRRVRRFF
jgi:hypothetical protein